MTTSTLPNSPRLWRRSLPSRSPTRRPRNGRPSATSLTPSTADYPRSRPANRSPNRKNKRSSEPSEYPRNPCEALPLMSQPNAAAPAEAQAVRHLAAAYEQMTEQIGKVIVGQKQVVEQLLMALFSRGHCLLVGVPGLAKTLLVSTVSKILHLSFKRIQFTPDLMPSDITGTDILQDDPETGRRKFAFLQGPLFANMILADEINRTPPKTQAALLEAMQEHNVTAGGNTYKLPEPFFVLATQNPIEQEGTYPLPEAQQDRFMFHIKVDYPSRAEEIQIMKTTTSNQKPEVEPILDAKQ